MNVLTDISETFKVLGDETRLRIFEALGKEELCVSEIAKRTEISESAVSHQLRILRLASLVSSNKAGKKVYYRIADKHVGHMMNDCREHVLELRG
ncbi:MAG: metalloregulator ArsR/SmtB family transcription factor [Candidatus Altiarchaeales archaeon]|nr:metalloregulator ArsR/SmtB family transcription factor [Candidatus Altiarchaeota archaeon]MCG2782099.1 metalloregulator ArsR/SmtB family transcription factor [Candidatus Altiarchaeales archaeon]MBU4265638.1 metalloregulator ArsR/SmtB family transcription factor [Candidatus Altiarchaeota archaeon]MBU4341055.1 metalloregulator ArsR/SmtB family transcription factor [Candidatus Altiarchaeota archaeon]MBU4406035.1 metalloregulator ArsR/SmtB family transcription factor [Candidatus Altiarchaeota ar